MYKILAVSNRGLCPGGFLLQVEKLAKAGCPLILREKDLPLAEYETLARQVLEVYQKYHTECTLHFYPQAARALGAGRLHLPLWKLREQPDLAREFTVGVSTHSLEEAREGQKLGAAYVTAGHIFATDCKKDVLRQVCAGVDIPVFAIGGISPDNARQAIEAGAEGVCMMSALMQTADPKAFLEKQKSKWEEMLEK